MNSITDGVSERMLNMQPLKWKLSILRIVYKCISFYCQNANLLLPKPKTSLRHLKLGIQPFHMNKRKKRLPLETKNTLQIRKWESRFY